MIIANMSSERKRIWPVVSIEKIDPEWWDEVMEGTKSISSKFDPKLDDEHDFTIRSITHILLNKKRKVVEWYMEGSVHLDQILHIYDLLHGSVEEKSKGQASLDNLIKDYTNDTLME
ncbi:MAG: hypothetical protein HY044_04945 [Candidatus Woesebacteria bacterium]|nr:MAG: hypothetical protein HY044_04945 [Candidatus Woesebacteria bacterium]